MSGDDSRWARADTLAFSSAGDRLVLLAYYSLTGWETATGRRKGSFELPHASTGSSPDDFFPPIPNLSSDGRFALTLVRDKEEARALVWNVAQHRRLHSLNSFYRISSFSPDSSLLATWEIGKDSIIHLWEVHSGRG